MDEEPWLNLTTACTFPEPTTMRKPAVDLRDREHHVSAVALSEYAGTYGNYAYGNVTVSVDEDAEMLELRYGILGHWVLYAEEEPHHFVGEGQNDAWSIGLYDVKFSGIEEGLARFVELTSLDNRAPPIFERGLMESDAPPPPELECPHYSHGNSAHRHCTRLGLVYSVILGLVLALKV